MKATITKQITGLSTTKNCIKTEKSKEPTKTVQISRYPTITNWKSALRVLVGNDCYSDIMLDEQKNIQESLYTVKSKFGWIISGRQQERYIDKTKVISFY